MSRGLLFLGSGRDALTIQRSRPATSAFSRAEVAALEAGLEDRQFSRAAVGSPEGSPAAAAAIERLIEMFGAVQESNPGHHSDCASCYVTDVPVSGVSWTTQQRAMESRVSVWSTRRACTTYLQPLPLGC